MFCPEVMKPCAALGVSATQNGRRILLFPVLARFFGNSPRGLPESQFHWHFHWHWPPLEHATRCNSATWSWRRGSESGRHSELWLPEPSYPKPQLERKLQKLRCQHWKNRRFSRFG